MSDKKGEEEGEMGPDKQGCCACLCKALGLSCGDVAKQVKHGVNKKNRTCTDLLFVFVFFAAFVGLATVWGIAAEEGDIDRLMKPMDYEGNVCGKGIREAQEVGFWPSVNSYKFKMCAETCEVTTKNIGVGIPQPPSDMENSVPIPTNQFKQYCLPEGSQLAGYDDPSEQGRRMIEDLTTAFPTIAGAAGFTLLVGLVYVCLVRACLGFIVWMACICTVFASGFCGYSLYWTADLAKDDQTKMLQRVAGAIMLVFAGGFLLMMICLRQRIRIAISVRLKTDNR